MLHSSSCWKLEMAGRDARASRKRCLLFVSSITLGVAALMAILGFGRQLRQGLDYQAKTLLAPILWIRTRQPSTRSADTFPRLAASNSRNELLLHGVVSKDERQPAWRRCAPLKEDFPFFREMETESMNAAVDFRPRTRLSLVEDVLSFNSMLAVGENPHRSYT